MGSNLQPSSRSTEMRPFKTYIQTMVDVLKSSQQEISQLQSEPATIEEKETTANEHMGEYKEIFFDVYGIFVPPSETYLDVLFINCLNRSSGKFSGNFRFFLHRTV